MLEPITWLLGAARLLGSPLRWGKRWLGKRIRWFQPAAQSGKLHSFYPSKLLEVVRLQSPRARVSSSLGEPDYELGNRWTYMYEKVIVQLAFRDDGGSLDTIVLGFTGDSKRNTVEIPWTDVPLGKLTLKEASEYTDDGLASLEYTNNLSTSELVLRTRLGPRGAWQYISFGALCPLVGPLAETSFE